MCVYNGFVFDYYGGETLYINDTPAEEFLTCNGVDSYTAARFVEETTEQHDNLTDALFLVCDEFIPETYGAITELLELPEMGNIEEETCETIEKQLQEMFSAIIEELEKLDAKIIDARNKFY